jgi:nucleoside-diphosphate-sugar epimerase
VRILLTGATGFIGGRLARRLVSGGHEVISLGRRPCGIAGVEDRVIERLEVPCIGEGLAGRRFDAVFHLAAAGVAPEQRDAAKLFALNSELPAAIVAAAAAGGASAVVLAGSSAEYRQSGDGKPLTEQAPLETSRLYGASKAAGGRLALACGAGQGVAVGVARLFQVFGPGEPPHRLLTSLVEGLQRKQPVPLTPGSQVRDFVHVDDACSGMLALLAALRSGSLPSGAYNISTGKGRSVAEFARATAQLLKADEELLKFGALPLRPDDLPSVVGDASLIRRACSWAPTYTMEQGIEAALLEIGCH